MAILNINYKSQLMDFCSQMNVILPQDRTEGEELPVLYLLHGLSGNHNSWMQQTSIVRYVQDMYPQLCVVMPAGDRSFYTDMAYGKDYYTHITDELPQILRNMFHITSNRDRTYIAGLSMGGYGALKIGLSKANKYSKIASFSPVADIQIEIDKIMVDDASEWKSTVRSVYGQEGVLRPVDDAKQLANKCIKDGNAPKLLLCCGKEDFLYENYCGYIDYLDDIGYKYTRYDDDGYEHTWDYWDICIQRALRFFARG